MLIIHVCVCHLSIYTEMEFQGGGDHAWCFGEISPHPGLSILNVASWELTGDSLDDP